MGRTKRKYNQECIKLNRALQKPFGKTMMVLPKDFSDDDYILAFKECFPYWWNYLQKLFVSYKRMDEMRASKGFHRLYCFPSPKNYIKRNACHIIKGAKRKPNTLTDEERKQIKIKLIEEGCKRKYISQAKINDRLNLVQKIKPSHENYFIQIYFRLKHNHPDNVNDRMAVVLEAGKYQCPTTIQFLHKVNASERNFTIRHQAFAILQGWGEVVRLHKNRKGRKHKGDTLIPEIVNTPEKLLERIISSQMEQTKHYDVFLSHSSSDKDLMLKIKVMLNALGLHVYMDWMNDDISLKRELTSADTARVIKERIEKSYSIVYVHTENSLQSRWTPWELGYADALDKKIAVYSPYKVERPPYLDIYDQMLVEGNNIKINNGANLVDITLWLNKRI